MFSRSRGSIAPRSASEAPVPRASSATAPRVEDEVVLDKAQGGSSRSTTAWVLPFFFGVFTALTAVYFSGSCSSAIPCSSAPRCPSTTCDAPRARSPPPSVKDISTTSERDAAPSCDPASAPPLWSIGLKTNTDKVTTTSGTGHAYQFPYEKYMRPLRCRPLNVLEIGLGCDMGIGEAGHSVAMWLEFMPAAALTVMEWNGKCMNDWRAADPMRIGKDVLQSRAQFFEGDQSKPADLLRVADARGPFDVIIDDGGHSANQQITSLRTLLKFVKPGGLYVLEDLETSFSTFHAFWHDFPTTAAQYIAQMINVLHWPKHAETVDASLYPGLVEIMPLVKSIDCSGELCVFTRWAAGEGPTAENAKAAAAVKLTTK